MIDYYMQVMNVSYVVYLLLLLLVVIFDVWKLIIPNMLCLAIAALFVPTVLLMPIDINWWSHIGAAFVVLAVGLVAYAFNVFGAGDIKLLTALSLWTGFEHLHWLLLYMAISGGVLTIVLIFLRRATLALTVAFRAAPEEVTLPRILVNREKVPYGVAIAVGAAIVGHSMLIELGLFL